MVFLRPTKLYKVTLDIDAEGWRPTKGFLIKKVTQLRTEFIIVNRL